jgi:hypothetical protein
MGVQLLKAQERQKTLFIFFLESKVGLLHFFSSLVRYSFSSTLRSTKFCCLQKKQMELKIIIFVLAALGLELRAC